MRRPITALRRKREPPPDRFRGTPAEPKQAPVRRSPIQQAAEIWSPSAIPVKYRAMPFRSCVLAVLALLCATPAAGAAEPGGAAVVLQLPPSMPPEAVRGLLKDLLAKGVEPREVSADPLVADPRPVPTSADLAARIWEAGTRAVRAIPNLAQVPEVWIRRAEDDGATKQEARWFWAIAIVGLAAAPLIGRGVRRLFGQRQIAATELGSAPRLGASTNRLLVALAALAVFSILFWTALLGVSVGRPIMEETADQLVWGAFEWRLSLSRSVISFSPGRPDPPPVPPR